VTVLVVEYGYFDDSPAQLQPQSASVWPPRDLFNLSSTPQTGLEGRVQSVLSANVVGGGSTINGMFLNRGSARDYDNWGKLNNDSSWTWNGIQPYFVKVGEFGFVFTKAELLLKCCCIRVHHLMNHLQP
jgi:choline dehydrogenase-like flavoprotein